MNNQLKAGKIRYLTLAQYEEELSLHHDNCGLFGYDEVQNILRDVDLTHNANNQTLKHKQKVKKYRYFTTPIVFNGVNYNAILTTELMKNNKDKNISDLYNVRIKKTSALNENFPKFNDTIPNQSQNVKQNPLSEGQTYDQSGQIQTDTAKFKEWFKDSKALDEYNKPLVFYHGSPDKFEEFSKEKIGRRDKGDFGKGFYFTPSEAYATDYSYDADSDAFYSTMAMTAEQRNKRVKGEVYPVYLSIQNPYYINNRDDIIYTTEELKKKGYDGIIAYGENVYDSFEDLKEDYKDIEDITNEFYPYMMHTKSEVLHSNTYADTIETLNSIAISIIDICFLYQITKEEEKCSKLAYEIILKAMSFQNNICFKIQNKLKIYSYKIACSDIKELTEKDIMLNNGDFCCLKDMQNLWVFLNDEASVNLEWDKEYANLQEKDTKKTNDKKSALYAKSIKNTNLDDMASRAVAIVLKNERDLNIINSITHNAVFDPALTFSAAGKTGYALQDVYAESMLKIDYAETAINIEMGRGGVDFVLVGAQGKNIFKCVKGFKPAAPTGDPRIGSFLLGTIEDRINVVYSRNIKADEFYVGYRGFEFGDNAVISATYVPLYI